MKTNASLAKPHFFSRVAATPSDELADKQEVVCGVILTLCLVSTFGICLAQIAFA